jgi:hypothetical protein
MAAPKKKSCGSLQVLIGLSFLGTRPVVVLGLKDMSYFYFINV